MIRCYHDIKQLAAEIDCPVGDLIAMTGSSDPFYAGVPSRREKALWFAELWERFGFSGGFHLRRVHYVLISQGDSVLKPDGGHYVNTVGDWKLLVSASLAARYLRLVPADALVDRRNPEPVIYAGSKAVHEPWIEALSSTDRLVSTLPDRLDLPELCLGSFDRDQDFLVELWIEKSTMDDILNPLARRLGCNLVTGLGEMSEIAVRNAVGRAADAGKPMRILYISDLDPKGRQMPVSTARKIEFLIRDAELDLDIHLHPIALTPEQCEEYALPRAPIEKRGHGGADRFEALFGEGATELDALEALHPGELRTIVEREVGRFLDPTLRGRVLSKHREISRQLNQIDARVHHLFVDEIEGVQSRFQEIRDALADLESEVDDLWSDIADHLENEAPEITAADVPDPRDAEPFEEPLYDSRRSYLEQLDHYRAWQRRGGAR